MPQQIKNLRIETSILALQIQQLSAPCVHLRAIHFGWQQDECVGCNNPCIHTSLRVRTYKHLHVWTSAPKKIGKKGGKKKKKNIYIHTYIHLHINRFLSTFISSNAQTLKQTDIFQKPSDRWSTDLICYSANKMFTVQPLDFGRKILHHMILFFKKMMKKIIWT